MESLGKEFKLFFEAISTIIMEQSMAKALFFFFLNIPLGLS